MCYQGGFCSFELSIGGNRFRTLERAWNGRTLNAGSVSSFSWAARVFPSKPMIYTHCGPIQEKQGDERVIGSAILLTPGLTPEDFQGVSWAVPFAPGDELNRSLYTPTLYQAKRLSRCLPQTVLLIALTQYTRRSEIYRPSYFDLAATSPHFTSKTIFVRRR